MAGIRAVRDSARRDLHLNFEVAANYYANADCLPGDFVACTVRCHKRNALVGDLVTPGRYAATADVVPKIIFLLEQGVTPQRGGIVILSASEGYVIDHTEPPDGVTQSAPVTALSAAQIAAYEAPSG